MFSSIYIDACRGGVPPPVNFQHKKHKGTQGDGSPGTQGDGSPVLTNSARLGIIILGDDYAKTSSQKKRKWNLSHNASRNK